MAAPALALQAAQPVLDAAKEERAKFDADPIQYIGNVSLKLGLGFTAVGALAYATSQATGRASQQFLTDIDTTMGIQQETPATGTAPPPPPAPPTVPAYVTQFNRVVADLNSLDPGDAGASVRLLQDAISVAVELRNTLYGVTSGLIGLGATTTQTPPPGADGDALNLVLELCRATYFLLGDTPSLDVGSSFTAEEFWAFVGGAQNGTSSGETKWSAARDAIGGGQTGENSKQYLNNLATDLGIQKPYDLSPAGSGATLWGAVGLVVGTVASVEQQAVVSAQGAVSTAQQWGATAVKDATAIVGDVENGLRIIGTAIVNAPRLTFDALGYGLSTGINAVTTDAYPYLLGIGGAFLGVAAFCKWFWPKYGRRLFQRVEVRANARASKWFRSFDRKQKIPVAVAEVEAQKPAEEAILAANAAPETPERSPVSGLTGEAGQPPPGSEPPSGEVPSAPDTPAVPEPAPAAAATPTEAPLEGGPAAPDSNTPVETSHESQGVSTPTSEVEAQLGEPNTTEEVPEESPGRREAHRASRAFAEMSA